METLKTKGGHGLRLFVMLFARDSDDLCDGIGYMGDECPQKYLEDLQWEEIQDRIMKDESRYPDVHWYQSLNYTPISDEVHPSKPVAEATSELLGQAWQDRHRKGTSPEADGRAPDPTWDYFLYEVVDEKLVFVASTVARR